MTYALPSTTPRRRTHVGTVDIAGTAWPVYKVEALVLGALVFLGALAFTTSLQVAVLTGAAATVVTWWTLLFAERRATVRR
ncbi:hypothetical protein CH289_21015 [Rhodococcus sp. RS1C4]|uniref:hypothetical protein n=1 Tax=Nocardiaceae TaxID=85025 RepID=UPI0003645EF8|nr:MULTISPECIES: hypothetical protein [Rhodococcus]OZC47712.1 hypothetical protein CH289_21015 [Rhodococcus sp. RS1C4]